LWVESALALFLWVESALELFVWVESALELLPVRTWSLANSLKGRPSERLETARGSVVHQQHNRIRTKGENKIGNTTK
jgi:hypothetical protein